MLGSIPLELINIFSRFLKFSSVGTTNSKHTQFCAQQYVSIAKSKSVWSQHNSTGTHRVCKIFQQFENNTFSCLSCHHYQHQKKVQNYMNCGRSVFNQPVSKCFVPLVPCASREVWMRSFMTVVATDIIYAKFMQYR